MRLVRELLRSVPTSVFIDQVRCKRKVASAFQDTAPPFHEPNQFEPEFLGSQGNTFEGGVERTGITAFLLEHLFFFRI